MSHNPAENECCLPCKDLEVATECPKDGVPQQESPSEYSVDSILKEASQLIDFQMEQIKSDLKAKEALMLSMREKILKRVPVPKPELEPELEPEPKSKQEEETTNRLREKLQKVLKSDEKLEAEAERSIADISMEMKKHQAQLKKLHESQLKEYLVVQEEIKASFHKDMDHLMQEFDAEMSRFRKDNAELLKQKKDSHQP